MTWRVFSTLMTTTLAFLTLAEIYRFLTVGNDHMAIDTIVCAGMTAFWIHHSDRPAKKVAVDLSTALAFVFVAFVGWVAIHS